MMSKHFKESKSLSTLTTRGTPSLHRMVHVAVSNATCITGTRPVVQTIVKESPFDIYANSDVQFSKWEEPWHIVSQVSRSHGSLVEDGSSVVELCLTAQQNPSGAGPPNFETRNGRPPLYTGNTALQTQQNNASLRQTGRDEVATRESRIERRALKVGYVRNNTGSGEETARLAPTSWVLRISQGRKLFMRVFPYELQNIMHAFGEVRYCRTDVLEFMEDAVRDITQRVALGVLARFNTDNLTVSDVSTCIRHDPRALHRLLFCLRRAKQEGDDLHVVRPTHREWDSFLHYATIHGIRVGEFPSLKHLEHVPLVRTHISCSEKARSMFWKMLGPLFKSQHAQCMQSYLTDRYSRCPTKGIAGRLRIDLFREWLALPEYVQVTEGTLHALGSLAREAVGIITQTALVLKHRRGLVQSYERLLTESLGFGIGGGVLVPLSALQSYEMLRVIDEMGLVVKREGNVSCRDCLQEGALEISHVREALRQLEDPGALAAHRPFWIGL